MTNSEIRMAAYEVGRRDGLAGMPFHQPEGSTYHVEGYCRGYRAGEKLAAISAVHRGNPTIEQILLVG